jgi:hypothetical protein
MRLAVTLSIVLLATATAANADVLTVYLQGVAGEGGQSAGQLMPGGSPALGTTLGFQIGARALFGEAYFDRTDYTQSGNVSRAVLGVHDDIGGGRIKLELRAGGGLMTESNGAVDGDASMAGSRTGFVARAGADLEGQIASHFSLGAAVDGEYFRLDDTHKGTDLLASVHLRLAFGL